MCASEHARHARLHAARPHGAGEQGAAHSFITSISRRFVGDGGGDDMAAVAVCATASRWTLLSRRAAQNLRPRGAFGVNPTQPAVFSREVPEQAGSVMSYCPSLRGSSHSGSDIVKQEVPISMGNTTD
eukprot:6195819-Pleurochrysis_carterae.AAC.2